MSRIKGKNTKPEMLVRKFLHVNGFRYKLHDKSLPGQTGIVAVSTAGQTAGKGISEKGK
jgi:G:T-mismatch repair DNA endonuclease (very short patch repair protein)